MFVYSPVIIDMYIFLTICKIRFDAEDELLELELQNIF